MQWEEARDNEKLTLINPSHQDPLIRRWAWARAAYVTLRQWST